MLGHRTKSLLSDALGRNENFRPLPKLVGVFIGEVRDLLRSLAGYRGQTRSPMYTAAEPSEWNSNDDGHRDETGVLGVTRLSS